MTDGYAYIGEYTGCNDLREQQLRFSKLQYGSTNISVNGHPHNSGVIDGNTLCVFRPAERVCREVMQSTRPSQTAVRHQTVRQQLNGSFRSAERLALRKVTQQTKQQQIHCAHIVQNA